MLKIISVICITTIIFITTSFTQSNNDSALLYSQTYTPSTYGGGSIISSYDLFEQTMRAQAADDFIASEDWSIDQVVVPNGSYFYPEMAEGFNIYIYKNFQNKPDSLVYFAASQSYSLESGLTTIILENPANLIANHYWISVQAITDMKKWEDEVWAWLTFKGDIENKALFKNPGNPFGPADWISISNDPYSNGTTDMYFELYGTSANTSVTGIADEVNPPSTFKLEQNYPNPFNPSTKIGWQSPVSSWQTLKIHDVLGNEVATLLDEYKPAGNYEVEFDASNLPSGTYFYQLRAGSFFETKKMILLK